MSKCVLSKVAGGPEFSRRQWGTVVVNPSNSYCVARLIMYQDYEWVGGSSELEESWVGRESPSWCKQDGESARWCKVVGILTGGPNFTIYPGACGMLPWHSLKCVFLLFSPNQSPLSSLFCIEGSTRWCVTRATPPPRHRRCYRIVLTLKHSTVNRI